ncbi:MAG: hypothetical protein R2878_01570 [Thermoleophilia bacterium]
MADEDDRLEYEGDTGRRPLPPADDARNEFDLADEMFEDDPDSVFFEEYEDVDAGDDRPEPEDFGFDEIARGEEPLTAAERRRQERQRGRGGRGGRGGVTRGLRAPKRRSRSGGRGGGGGGRRGGTNSLGIDNRTMRLGLGVLFAVVLIAVLALVVRDCRRDAQIDAYKQYVNNAAQVSEESAKQGPQLLTVLNNGKAQGVAALQQRVEALANQAQALQDRAAGLSPPGKLSSANDALLLGLQYRTTGLRSLQGALPEIVSQSDTAQAANLIKQNMKMFTASDVIVETSFIEPTSQALRDEGIQNVAPPDPDSAKFLRGSNDRYATDQFAKLLVAPLRRQRASTGSGSNSSGGGDVHGTNLVSVTALPSGTLLSSSGTDLATDTEGFRVVVHNGGDFVENNINVTATLTYPDQSEPAASLTATIDTIDASKDVSIDVKGLTTDNLTFGTQGTLQVTVATVTGEENGNNNSARYPVKFVLG